MVLCSGSQLPPLDLTCLSIFVLAQRRVQQYFKDMQVNIKNWERIAETTKLLYPADQEYAAIESIGHVTSEAQKSYEAAWNQMREMMIKYESSIKNMGRKITDRDNARVDFDRARAKAEKSNNDPVLEATARASEQVYTEKNFAATESLDYFLETRLENLSAIMSFFARATCAMYSSCASFGEIEVVVAPAPELALAAGTCFGIIFLKKILIFFFRRSQSYVCSKRKDS